MGQAKIRKQSRNDVAYHHTSTLRTNLIWMSGVIDLEGTDEPVLHPQLGMINSNLGLRRAALDFPRVAWFTKNISVPKCLILSSLVFCDPETGENKSVQIPDLAGHGISLNRMALGFSIKEHNLIPWPDYYGYKTKEGLELNETAIAAGDDPNEWLISESQIDVATIVEAFVSRSIYNPKLERADAYVHDIKKMVELCRTKKAFIPPSWLSPELAKLLSIKLGYQIHDFGGKYK